MKLNSYNSELFVQFKTSTNVDGNYTGKYEGRVIRIIEKNQGVYKDLLNQVKSIPNLIKADIIFEDENKLIFEHPEFENITYYNEWTKKQRVEAALAIIQIQEHLSNLGYYLNDPHGFNITFTNTKPVYFDFGSIHKGKIKPVYWYLKSFCGLTAKDYWDDILGIGLFKKIYTAIILLFHSLPYKYLQKSVKKSEHGKLTKIAISATNKSELFAKMIRKLSKIIPVVFGELTNWTDYDQKNPETLERNERTENTLSILKKYKPSSIIDIGANRGAYSFLALKNGCEKAICLDLDSHSLDELRNRAKLENGNIITAIINIMDYDETPGCYNTYLPAHRRLNSDFGICLAVVHHVCYFGNSTFDEFAERLSRFVNKILVIEFVPFDDIHLTGPVYKGKDRSWYTQENFIKALNKYFPGEFEIYKSTPEPRILMLFNK